MFYVLGCEAVLGPLIVSGGDKGFDNLFVVRGNAGVGVLYQFRQ